MYDSEFLTKENKNLTKGKIEPQHLHQFLVVIPTNPAKGIAEHRPDKPAFDASS